MQSIQQTVTTTAAPIVITDTDSAYGHDVYLYNETTGTNKQIAIGGPTVTLGNGVHLYGGEKYGPIRLGHADVLYAISNDATGYDLRVLVVGA